MKVTPRFINIAVALPSLVTMAANNAILPQASTPCRRPKRFPSNGPPQRSGTTISTLPNLTYGVLASCFGRPFHLAMFHTLAGITRYTVCGYSYCYLGVSSIEQRLCCSVSMFIWLQGSGTFMSIPPSCQSPLFLFFFSEPRKWSRLGTECLCPAAHLSKYLTSCRNAGSTRLKRGRISQKS